MTVDIPKKGSDDQSFLSGQVFVNNHDVCTDPSNPWRHAAQLVDPLKEHPEKTVVVVEHDGGPDHNIKHFEPLLSMICLMLMTDIIVYHARDPPKHTHLHNLVDVFEGDL